jgi:hypothetical protein
MFQTMLAAGRINTTQCTLASPYTGVPQPMGMHSPYTGLPQYMEKCIPIHWGTPIYGGMHPTSRGTPRYENASQYTVGMQGGDQQRGLDFWALPLLHQALRASQSDSAHVDYIEAPNSPILGSLLLEATHWGPQYWGPQYWGPQYVSKARHDQLL